MDGPEITANLVAEIDRLLAAGSSTEQIAVALGIGVYVVVVISGDEDRHRPPPPARRRKRKRKPRPRTRPLVSKPAHPDLSPGERLAPPNTRCPICHGSLAVIPCRACVLRNLLRRRSV